MSSLSSTALAVAARQTQRRAVALGLLGVLLFALSGTLMVSKTLRIPKP